MAKKGKTQSRIGRSLGGLEAGLKGLGIVEKDLEKVRANLRKFLNDAEKILSGPIWRDRRPRKRGPKTRAGKGARSKTAKPRQS